MWSGGSRSWKGALNNAEQGTWDLTKCGFLEMMEDSAVLALTWPLVCTYRHMGCIKMKSYGEP